MRVSIFTVLGLNLLVFSALGDDLGAKLQVGQPALRPVAIDDAGALQAAGLQPIVNPPTNPPVTSTVTVSPQPIIKPIVNPAPVALPSPVIKTPTNTQAVVTPAVVIPQVVIPSVVTPPAVPALAVNTPSSPSTNPVVLPSEAIKLPPIVNEEQTNPIPADDIDAVLSSIDTAFSDTNVVKVTSTKKQDALLATNYPTLNVLSNLEPTGEYVERYVSLPPETNGQPRLIRFNVPVFREKH